MAVHPAFLYAFEQCGFLVSELNKHLMTQEQLDEWEAAIDHYFRLHPDAPPLDAPEA